MVDAVDSWLKLVSVEFPLSDIKPMTAMITTIGTDMAVVIIALLIFHLMFFSIDILCARVET